MRIALLSVLIAVSLLAATVAAATFGEEVNISEGRNATIGNYVVKMDSVAASGTAKVGLTLSRDGKSISVELSESQSKDVTIGSNTINIKLASVVLGRSGTIILSNERQTTSSDFNPKLCFVTIREGGTTLTGGYNVTVDSVAASGTAKASITVCKGNTCSASTTFTEQNKQTLDVGADKVTISVNAITLGRSVSLDVNSQTTYSYTEYKCSDTDGGQSTNVKGTVTAETVTVSCTADSFTNKTTERKSYNDYCTQYGVQEYYCTSDTSVAKSPLANKEIFPENGYHCSNGVFVKTEISPVKGEPAAGGVQTTEKPSAVIEPEKLPIREIKPTSPVIEKAQKAEEAIPNRIVGFVNSIRSFIRPLFSEFFGSKESQSIHDSTVIVLDTKNISEVKKTVNFIKDHGGIVPIVYLPNTIVASKLPINIEPGLKLSYGAKIYRGADKISVSDKVPALKNALSTPKLKPVSKEIPEAFEEGPVIIPDDKPKQFVPAGSLGYPPPASIVNTSAYMIGDVFVSVILPESNGSIDENIENWDAEEEALIDSAVANGLGWLVEISNEYGVNNPVNGYESQLTFWMYPQHYKISTSYEASQTEQRDNGKWIGETLDALKVPQETSVDRLRSYDNLLRSDSSLLKDRTGILSDWAFVLYFVDRSKSGGAKYVSHAYLGGPSVIAVGPADEIHDDEESKNFILDGISGTVAHETGHVFWALDEYIVVGNPCSCTEKSGILEVENQNCDNGCKINSALSIMRSGSINIKSGIDVYAAGQIGWRDENKNGIIDAIDSAYNKYDDDIDDDGVIDYWDTDDNSPGPISRPYILGYSSAVTSNNEMGISFETYEDTTVTVEARGLSSGVIASVKDMTLAKSHYLTLKNLEQNEKYKCEIKIYPASGKKPLTKYCDFETYPVTISDYSIDIDEYNTVEIKFSTNVNTITIIDADCGGCLTDSFIEESTPKKSHRFVLRDLEPGKSYDCEIATNPGKKRRTTKECDFVTYPDKNPPVFSDVKVATETTTATITWSTDELSGTFLAVGKIIDIINKIADVKTLEENTANLVYFVDGDYPAKTKHTVVVPYLTPGTRYYYKIFSKDATGNEKMNPLNIFTTKSVATEKLPNLFANGMTFFPSSPKPGDSVTTTITITNSGDGSATIKSGTSFINLHGAGLSLGVFKPASDIVIPSGSTKTISLNSIPFSFKTERTVTITASINADRSVKESNTDDNILKKDIKFAK